VASEVDAATRDAVVNDPVVSRTSRIHASTVTPCRAAPRRRRSATGAPGQRPQLPVRRRAAHAPAPVSCPSAGWTS
jgi:hypothetical protein